VRHQCKLLGLNRSTLYYEPAEVSEESLEIMRLIDQQYMNTPFYGARRFAEWLKRKGFKVSRRRVRTLMKLMGKEAIYRKPRTTKPAPGHKIYPYLLRGLPITRPNQVWATDLTYIPMKRGFMYLVAIIDWHSRYVLSWRLSNTMELDFCVEALKEAIERYGPPEIFNSDQGSQFTSTDFTDVLKEHQIKISMDGKGRCIDNIFVERLWRSLKYEEVYLHAYNSPLEARLGIGRYLNFFNRERPHQGLEYKTPAEVYEQKKEVVSA
jgi:putative transposase